MLRPALMMSICAALTLGGCGGGERGWNPLGWFRGGNAPRAPATLEPKGGYDRNDPRLPVAQVLSARWEPLVEGRLLVVTALAPTRGWWDVALVTETLQPPGRLRADADGVLRLRLVGAPPPADSAAARAPARPGPDTLTAALAISAAALDGIGQVVISGGANAVTLRN